MGSCQNPWAASVVQLLADWGMRAILLQWLIICLQAWPSLGSSSGNLRPSGLLTCISNIPSYWAYPHRDSWMFLAPSGCPEITVTWKATAISFSLVLAYPSSHWVLFLLSLVSLLNTPKATFRNWGMGIWVLNYNFKFLPNISGRLTWQSAVPVGHWPSEVKRSILVFPKGLTQATHEKGLDFLFFLGHSFNLFIIDFSYTSCYLLIHMWSCASCLFLQEL